MVNRLVAVGLMGMIWSCGKPAAEKAAAPMESSSLFGKLETTATKDEVMVTLELPAGKAEPAFLGALVNAEPSGAGACYLIAEVATGKARLVNDNGSGSQELGDKAAVSNRQCELKAAGTRLERTGGRLEVHFGVAFQKGFAGRKQLYGIAMDGNGAGRGLEPGRAFVVAK